MDFGDQFFGRMRRRVGMLRIGAVPQNTAFQMLGQKLQTQRIERRANGADLVENIEAIAVFLDHLLHAADLSGDAIGARPNFFARFGFHILG